MSMSVAVWDWKIRVLCFFQRDHHTSWICEVQSLRSLQGMSCCVEDIHMDKDCSGCRSKHDWQIGLLQNAAPYLQ
jgi:hypothetical protein